MNLFERYLTLWVGICIVVGIGLGQLFPGIFQFVGRIEVAHINLPVAVLVWLMIIPMLIKIDLRQLKGVREHWRGVGVTLFVNWGVKPFSMALLAWFFIGFLFRGIPSRGTDRLLHRRPGNTCSRTVYGNGVRLEQPDARRTSLSRCRRWR